jgi:signal peptidase I
MFGMKRKEPKPQVPFFSVANIKETLWILLIIFVIRTYIFGLYQVPSGSMETTMLVGDRFFADKFTYLFTSPKRGDIISFNEPTYNYSKDKLKLLFEEYVWGPANWTKRVIGVPGDVVEGKIEDGKPVVYLNGNKLDEPYLNKYPLIAVLKQDPSGLRQHARRNMDEFWRNNVTTYSYDPNASYADQPFYRLYADRIVPDADGKPYLIWPGTPIREPQRDCEKMPKEGNYWDGSDIFRAHLGEGEYWCMGDNRLGSKDCRCFGPINQRLIHGKIVFLIWSLDSDAYFFLFDLLQHPIDFFKRVRWSRCLSFMH